jgi:signal transduction histidine kinase
MGEARQGIDAALSVPTVRAADALRLTFEAADVAIIAFDVEGTVLFVNRRLIELCSIPPDMIERGRFREMFEHSRQLLSGAERDRPCLDPTDELEPEARIPLIDGRVMHRRSTPVREPGTQRLIGQVLSFTDITAEDRALQALHESEAQARRRAAELAAARRAAAVASQVKREFLSHMSHELRTPLNAILGFTQLLALDPARPLSPQQRMHVEQISLGGDQLLELIDQLLDLARIEADQIELNIAEIDPKPVVELSLAAVHARAQRQQVGLQCQALPDVLVRADPMRLEQVLTHLLTNAVKYNRPSGQAAVSLQRAGAFVRFEVRDTGLGIAEHLQERLFNPFDRLDADRGAIAGTGVGLAICRHFIEGMGGQIGVESEPGQGSTFWFTLLPSNAERPTG